jgi:hypothetical protein
MKIDLHKARQKRREDGYAAAMIVLTLASVAVSAYSAVAAGDAQKEAADYNAKVQKGNAEAAMAAAQIEQQKIDQVNRARIGSMRASMASTGVSANEGSFLDVAYNTKLQGEWDKITALYKGRVAATGASASAKLFEMEGSAAQTAGYINAGSTVLSGATSLYSHTPYAQGATSMSAQ